ncbi:baseplate J/gp47 family protein [Terribacillus saccharophilus]|uniref:baseplate J/gp47 family protein n=1 Tax=Terribacillus saccharophilus TaxID=361277 RepID=UPI000BA564B0|nr:baseplate J/gp47 family protein [Terribacillus saccharophilus]PAF18618.1 phage portal protein [Terribacillus saccharophilus]
MFEDQSFELIMERMLERVPADIDKREGSVIWNALAPAAAELAQSYIWLDTLLEQVFADTAQGEFLDRRALEGGVTRNEATKAVRAAEFNMAVPAGTRFYLDGDNLYFVVLADGTLQCETAGSVGNGNFTDRQLLAINTIPGLERAVLKELLVPGTDEETDESLLQRYYVRVRREAVSANKQHYKQWAEELDGVGRAKVFPLWNGDGTVKIVVTDANMQPASDVLLKNVQDHIDPDPAMGDGEAPIGATVTVESAVWKDINISASVLPVGGRTLAEVKAEIQEEVNKLFKRIAFEESIVRLSQINNIVYNADSVSDYADIEINGKPENLELEDVEIPRLGEVTIVEQV